MRLIKEKNEVSVAELNKISFKFWKFSFKLKKNTFSDFQFLFKIVIELYISDITGNY